jgi:glutathione S-transferase
MPPRRRAAIAGNDGSEMITLYDYILCDNCYKVRLLLAMLRLDYVPSKVNVHPGRECETAEFRSINPLGRIPVLKDGDLVLRDPQAILTYLALRYDAARRWLPSEAAAAGCVAMWLAFSCADLDCLSVLRMNRITGARTDAPGLLQRAHNSLTVLEDHLAEGEILGSKWVAADQATIADIAIFPPVALAADGGITLERYPAIWRWIDRVKRLDGFVVMPGITPNLASPS